MATKARIAKMEQVFGDGQGGGTEVYVSTVDGNGVIRGGRVDPEEYFRWHPRGTEIEHRAPPEASGSIKSRRRRVEFVTAIPNCIELECPWHGELNRLIVSRGGDLSWRTKSNEELIEELTDKYIASGG